MKKTKYNIDLYCICWNEMKILPFVVDYWKEFVRHAYVYDNGSDDGSIEYLQQFDWITVRHFESDGINELAYLEVKNNAWKESNADFVVVCDTDECLYSKQWDKVLDFMVENNIALLRPTWIDIFSDMFPEYNETKLIHQICNRGKVSGGPKVLLFNPKMIKEINYCVGCHQCSPMPINKVVDGSNFIYTMHVKKLSPEYESERRKIFQKRLSSINKKMFWGTHYNDNDVEKLRLEYKDNNIVNLQETYGI